MGSLASVLRSPFPPLRPSSSSPTSKAISARSRASGLGTIDWCCDLWEHGDDEPVPWRRIRAFASSYSRPTLKMPSSRSPTQGKQRSMSRGTGTAVPLSPKVNWIARQTVDIQRITAQILFALRPVLNPRFDPTLCCVGV
ncbi:unnamed protein product [Ectocarpus sp. 12 AP-2014]